MKENMKRRDALEYLELAMEIYHTGSIFKAYKQAR